MRRSNNSVARSWWLEKLVCADYTRITRWRCRVNPNRTVPLTPGSRWVRFDARCLADNARFRRPVFTVRVHGPWTRASIFPHVLYSRPFSRTSCERSTVCVFEGLGNTVVHGSKKALSCNALWDPCWTRPCNATRVVWTGNRDQGRMKNTFLRN